MNLFYSGEKNANASLMIKPGLGSHLFLMAFNIILYTMSKVNIFINYFIKVIILPAIHIFEKNNFIYINKLSITYNKKGGEKEVKGNKPTKV